MACNCGRNRATATATKSTATAQPPGTYRVMVGSRKVYESSNQSAAETVGLRFTDASIETPTGSTLVYRNNTWTEQ